MTIGEFEDRIAEKLDIHTPSAFGLYEVALTEEERFIQILLLFVFFFLFFSSYYYFIVVVLFYRY